MKFYDKKKTLNVFWLEEESNFGDIVTPYILSKYGYNCQHVSRGYVDFSDMISTGSIARYSRKNMIVAGSGIMNMKDKLCPTAKWIWVRGPMTRDRVIQCGGRCPKLFGDPALLLPRLYNPKITKKYSIGIIPHYVDHCDVINMPPNSKLIDIRTNDIEKKIDEILECEKVISSSLHGLIVANAYGIPAARFKYNKISGDGIKFEDYAASVNSDFPISSFSKPKFNNFTINNKDLDIIEEILVTGNFNGG